MLNAAARRSSNTIDSFLRHGIDARIYTTCAAQVVQHGQTVFQACYGHPNPLNTQQQTTVETLFDLASLTKVFVASACMKMIEAGMLDLDTLVQELVPEFSGQDKHLVQIRHLLAHCSGLPASFDLYSTREWNKGKPIVLKKLFNTPLLYKPTGHVLYSCLNLMLLGYLLEVVSGCRLDLVLQKYLTTLYGWKDLMYKPDACRASIVLTTFDRPNRGPLAPGVVHDGNAIALDEGISGNAGLFGSVEAVSRLGEMCLTHKLFPPEIAAEMTSLQAESGTERRGLGWKLYSKDYLNPAVVLSPSAYGHNGFTGTSLWVDPQRDLTITLLTNSVHFYKSKQDAVRFNTFRIAFHKAVLGHLDPVCKMT